MPERGKAGACLGGSFCATERRKCESKITGRRGFGESMRHVDTALHLELSETDIALCVAFILTAENCLMTSLDTTIASRTE
ncbi:Hypothetical predicted protein [Pelobates cultripes]|uniref:Uncharacterized protein n=1 Tax=Pelobates cultripes TaxID=61616 RepID=A0AAD1RKK1_PELCU|nr:Hypothetical predicted protein [Pelobates cultripes]